MNSICIPLKNPIITGQGFENNSSIGISPGSVEFPVELPVEFDEFSEEELAIVTLLELVELLREGPFLALGSKLKIPLIISIDKAHYFNY